MSKNNIPGYVTVKQFSELTMISERSIRRWCQRGLIPCKSFLGDRYIISVKDASTVYHHWSLGNLREYLANALLNQWKAKNNAD